MTGPAGSPRGRTVLLIASVVLTAANLRTAVTTVGPLLEELERGLGMSSGLAGLLTTLPVLSFATFGALTPGMVRRWGEPGTLAIAMAAMTVGTIARGLSGSATMFLVTTVLALTGGAVGNVVLPAVVKRHFPNHTGAVVAAYTTAMAAGQATAAALVVPIAQLGGDEGWRLGVGIWAVLSAAAVVPWVFALRLNRRRPAVHARALRMSALARSPLAWALAVCFGTQSANAYIAFGWFAQFFRDAGVSAAKAGLLVAFVSVLAVPVSLIVPPLAARMTSQRPMVAVMVACNVSGYVGLVVAPVAGAWVWMLLSALGLGLFPLVLTLIPLRSMQPATTAALSGFVQGIGYVIAATGPLLVGVLRGATGGWTAPFVLIFALTAVMAVVFWYATGARYIDEPPTPVNSGDRRAERS